MECTPNNQGPSVARRSRVATQDNPTVFPNAVGLLESPNIYRNGWFDEVESRRAIIRAGFFSRTSLFGPSDDYLTPRDLTALRICSKLRFAAV